MGWLFELLADVVWNVIFWRQEDGEWSTARVVIGISVVLALIIIGYKFFN